MLEEDRSARDEVEGCAVAGDVLVRWCGVNERERREEEG